PVRGNSVPPTVGGVVLDDWVTLVPSTVGVVVVSASVVVVSASVVVVSSSVVVVASVVVVVASVVVVVPSPHGPCDRLNWPSHWSEMTAVALVTVESRLSVDE